MLREAALARDLRARLAHSRLVKRASLLLVLACSISHSIAHAEERSTIITIAGTFGVLEPTPTMLDYVARPDPMVGPRLLLSWEHAPLELPDTRGYRFAGAIVPELVGGAFIDDVRAQGYIGAGLRAELKMAQREMGLLRISARGGLYLAARGMVVGEERLPFGEFTLGEYIYIGRNTRLGFDIGVLAGRNSDAMFETNETSSTRVGMVSQFYLSWRP